MRFENSGHDNLDEAPIAESFPEHPLNVPDESDSKEVLGKIPNTQQFGLRKFPSLEQYYETVSTLSQGIETEEQNHLYALAQRDWHIRGQNGCMFARIAALKSENVGWNYSVIDPQVSKIDNTQVVDIHGSLEEAVRNSDTELYSLLFPGVTSAKSAVEIIRTLARGPKFWLEKDELIDSVLKLRLRYPVVENEVQAWVMAFGPFNFLPNTRQAPYFELVTRVKVKPETIFHRLNKDPAVAHLADIPLDMPEKYWEDRFDSTLRRTRMILGNEPDDVSAAKSTISIPEEYL